MTIHCKRLTIAAALSLLSGSACLAEADNPLIGKWKLTGIGFVDRDGNNYCDAVPEMAFTATTQIMFVAATKFRPAAQSTAKVTYLVSRAKIYVTSGRSFFNAPSYTMLTSTQVQSDAIGHCTYTKE